MTKIISFLIFSLTICSCVSTETTHKTPDTIEGQAGSVNNIEETNSSNPTGTGSFTLLLKRKDYGLTVTRLILDFGEVSLTGKDITENTFKVVDINKSDEGIQLITSISITDRQGYDAESGRYVTVELDFSLDPDSGKKPFYVVTLNKDLGKYKKGAKFIQKGRTVRR
ncbi:hypothetical protein ACFL6W_08475 [Thermodesulfobacteriota bacterium]